MLTGSVKFYYPTEIFPIFCTKLYSLRRLNLSIIKRSLQRLRVVFRDSGPGGGLRWLLMLLPFALWEVFQPETPSWSWSALGLVLLAALSLAQRRARPCSAAC